MRRRIAGYCGVIPERLAQLASARFDRLHHGIKRLAIVCHDVVRNTPHYFATGADEGLSLAEAVKASASMPHIFPTVSVECAGRILQLTDGGVGDPVPVAFARSDVVAATHVIVSDCRGDGCVPETDDATVWIRPRLEQTGTLSSPARGLALAVTDGERAVTDDIWDRISSWFAIGAPIEERPNSAIRSPQPEV